MLWEFYDVVTTINVIKNQFGERLKALKTTRRT